MTAPIRTTLEADGVLVATIDMAGRTMNVFSTELMDALDTLMDRVDADTTVRSCIVTSAKPAFIAGADLAMVRGFCDAAAHSTPAQMIELCGRLGRQFVRLEASAKPWVAAVNGLAMGGGLELALACRVRLVADDPRIQLGVPEVKLGLLPGAGGTQRLPRLVGFERALDLLLSGRSVTPADAVQWGIFARAVPVASLLDEARAVARSLHERAYDPAAKYPRLAQADVPLPGGADARAIAAQHGIDTERFTRFPAYHAIVDSVLLGARLPIPDANTVEMNQFLRLMFNPVAGRMIRTLFLERLRAERELAAPAGTKVERLAVGPISPARAPWRDALLRVKLPQAADDALPADTLVLVDGGGNGHAVALRVVDDMPEAAGAGKPALVLAPPGAWGRVMEIVDGGEAASAASALALQLRALPWPTPGPASVLQCLRGLPLADQARLARSLAATPGAGDPAFLDVAACLADVSPAWSGGPLTWHASETRR